MFKPQVWLDPEKIPAQIHTILVRNNSNNYSSNNDGNNNNNNSSNDDDNNNKSNLFSAIWH